MDNLFGNVYKGKKVFITGHTGFKGSWLTLWLKKLGAEVCGYSLAPNTKPNMFSICKVEEGIENIIGDIRDEKKVSESIAEFEPDIIFHLAAQPLVRYSYEYPKLTYETNVIGSINVYEAALKCKSVKAIVTITTDKCYKNREWVYGYRENDPMGGYDPYSSSKACVEILTDSYRRSYFAEKNIMLASARAGNVIGGGDWAEDRLIPDFIRSVFTEKELFIRNPSAIRPWQHVLEPLSGYLWLGAGLLKEKDKLSSAWNFGPDEASILSVKDVLDKSIEVLGRGKYKYDEKPQFHEAKLLKLDTSKARSVLDWRPVNKITESIEKTMLWYKHYYENKTNMREYTINEINDYVKRARVEQLKWS